MLNSPLATLNTIQGIGICQAALQEPTTCMKALSMGIDGFDLSFILHCASGTAVYNY